MIKIIISSILISLCFISGVSATASGTTSSGSVTTKPMVKKPIKKPIVKKPIVKKPVTPKTPKSQVTQTGSSMSTGTTVASGLPLGNEKGPLAVVLYKYVKADLTTAEIAYIDTSIKEIKAGLAYYEQERDPTLTPEKIKLNMKAFLSSAVNEMSDRDIFKSGSLDALKSVLNELIDGLGK